ncbi:DUF4351 domain-containing protein [Synechococcus sp. PCC 6312]|uniref:DUF4351 domain-containing protein n=1 Tax=Synechococcus sp. (strain ATCC 27167 / PCC 6312) TaxID=195253 RepID=UPI0002ECE8AA|nr:DUF4351 domain-containing protein [Synechococcus sp. PCC 6312]
MLGFTASELQKSRFYQEVKAEGLEEGRQEGLKQEAFSLVFRQLQRKLGDLPTTLSRQVAELPLAQLENLGEALLEFQDVSELQA